MKKMNPTTVLNKMDFEPVLMPRRKVKIEPLAKYGFYEVPASQPVEMLPPIVVNLASYTNTLAAFSDSGTQTTISSAISSLDMAKMTLAHYRCVALDNVLFSMNQPAAVGRFSNRAGVVSIGPDTQSFYRRQMWSMLPELFIFEDITRPTITATNTQYRTTAWARLLFFGWKYVLQRAASQTEDQTALTIRVEGS